MVDAHASRRALSGAAALLGLASAWAGCERRGSSTAGPTGDAGRDVAWQEPIEVATGAATRGPWRMNDSDFRWVDDPSVDISPSGEVAVAWVDQERKDVFFQRYRND